MSDRDRLRDAATGAVVGAGIALLAVVLLLTGLSANHRNQIRTQGYGGEYAAHDARVPSSAQEQEACARAREPSEDETEQREKDDLCAQFRSAAAAERMFVLSDGNNWLNYFNASALVVSLFFTGWAAVAASKAAMTAADSVALMERDLSESERPRVFAAYEDDDLWERHEGYDSFRPSAWFRVRNFGERTAVVYKSWTTVHVGPTRERPKPTDEMGPRAYPSIMEDTMVEPGASKGPLLWAQSYRKFTDEEFAQIEAKTHFVYVRGVVFFRDHLGESRVFGFCQVFSGKVKRRLGEEPDGFTFLEYTYDRKLKPEERGQKRGEH